MEEKNELNDIILNKSGSGSNSKKLLLAIAALTLILIIVLVIMNSLKSENNEQAPQAVTPPKPSSPTEVIDDPLFEPVEVIQEGASNVTKTEAPQDLGQIAQKIKQESFKNTPVQSTVQQPIVKSTPVVDPTIQVKPKVVATPVEKPVEAKVQPVVKTVQPAVNIPTIKTTKPVVKSATPTKITAAPVEKSAEKISTEKTETSAIDTVSKVAQKTETSDGVWYIQVGSFSKEPSKALFDHLNTSGLKYTTVPSGTNTKVMVGPFQSKKAAGDVIGNVKHNIESHAFVTQK
jgi:DedD protein